MKRKKLTVRRASEPSEILAHAAEPARTEIENAEIELSGIVDAILEVARQRKAILDDMRDALKSGDNQRVQRLARELCGLGDEKGNRTRTRVN